MSLVTFSTNMLVITIVLKKKMLVITTLMRFPSTLISHNWDHPDEISIHTNLTQLGPTVVSQPLVDSKRERERERVNYLHRHPPLLH